MSAACHIALRGVRVHNLKSIDLDLPHRKLIVLRCAGLVERTPKRYNPSMNTATQEILNTALQLSEKERADLAASLIESLDRPFDSDVQAAWADEIRRRLADLDSGAVKAIPWDEARQVIAGGTG